MFEAGDRVIITRGKQSARFDFPEAMIGCCGTVVDDDGDESNLAWYVRVDGESMERAFFEDELTHFI